MSLFFFFSSRRRHTRCGRDWSSDVCSSDLGDRVHAEVLQLADSGDVEADLRDLARRQLKLVMQPRVLQLRRLVIGEAGRFPELGRTFYDRGPGRTIEALSATFERLAKRGLLRLDD